MLNDWQIWRKTLAQAVLAFALVAALAFAGRAFAPAIARAVTGTPEPLLAVCQALETAPTRALLTGWVERSGDPTGDLRLDDVASRAMSILAGPDLTFGPELGEATGPDVAEYVLKTGDCYYRTCIRRIGDGADQKLYLVCSAEIREPSALADRQRRLDAALNTLGSGARRPEPTYATVFARLPGVLDDGQCRNAAQRVMARLRGRQMHEFDGNALYSLLSYSIMLGPAVEVAGRQVNLSVVLRPDTETGSTWVVIGTPLCAGDY